MSRESIFVENSAFAWRTTCTSWKTERSYSLRRVRLWRILSRRRRTWPSVVLGAESLHPPLPHPPQQRLGSVRFEHYETILILSLINTPAGLQQRQRLA